MSEPPPIINLAARQRELDEQWWRDLLETLTPEQREAEIANRGSLWRYLEPKLIEWCQRIEDTDGLYGR